MSHLFVMITN